MNQHVRALLTAFLVSCQYFSFSQSISDTLLPDTAPLSACVQYALMRQPVIQQSLIDEQITERTIKSKLADWFPQLNLDYNLQHFFQLPTIISPDLNNPGAKREIKNGVLNTSNFTFTLNQAIFNRDVLLASRSARDVRKRSAELTAGSKIDVVVAVSKAYYNVLLSKQQIKVLDENIMRLDRSLKDAFNQYQSGITDKIDYKRATISLNNTKADRKQAEEQINTKLAILKEAMGMEAGHPLDIVYDSLQMERDAFIDTTSAINYESRIEYQLLKTEQRLLKANVDYTRWNFLPTVSAFGNYVPVFQNDRFPDLYNKIYPYSSMGLKISLPIFQGTKRIQEKRIAELQLKRSDWDMLSLKNSINTEYVQALSSYKTNLVYLNTLRSNVELAKEVYNTLSLQYKSGVKTYLDVIISETDLRTAQVNYLNALNQLISSKLDVQRALGIISYQ